MKSLRALALLASILVGAITAHSRASSSADREPVGGDDWIQASEPMVMLSIFDKTDQAVPGEITFEVSSSSGSIFTSVRSAPREEFVEALFPQDFSGAGIIDSTTSAEYSWKAMQGERVVATGKFRLSAAGLQVVD